MTETKPIEARKTAAGLRLPGRTAKRRTNSAHANRAQRLSGTKMLRIYAKASTRGAVWL